MRRSRSTIAIPPGETIKEQLVDRGMKQKEFAVRMGMSEKHISRLINGDVQLTIEMARKLEMVLGVPTQFWCNLEAIYREDIAKVNEEKVMDEDIEIAKNMPYAEMVHNGWIIDVAEKKERVIHLRKYFELAELKYLQTTLVPRIACRKLHQNEKDDCALIAWVQKAKLEARRIETKPINLEKLKETIPLVRKQLELQSEEFYAQITELLANCGVAIVFLPDMNGFSLHGASFLDGNKIVIGIALCEEDKKEFSFNLFHELAHVIYGHIEKEDGTSEEDEKIADEYAERMIQ